MDRRGFLAAAGAVATMGAAGTAKAQESAEDRAYFELRKYIPLPGPHKKMLEDYLSQAAIPAWNRAGIEPVGVFSVLYGPNSPSLYVLLPHKTLDSLVAMPEKLAADEDYLKAAEPFLATPLAEPAFFRMESSLMRAFKMLPQLAVPRQTKESKARIFELRIYESHSPSAAKKKMQMFNEGGEIEIFKQAGLQPVLFGETLIGPIMPNLHYMLCFDDMADRDANWKNFINAPAWKKLSAEDQYKDTVSNISDIILKPTGYSQL